MTISNPTLMEVTKSQDFRQAGEQAQDILRLHGDALDSNQKRSLELDVLRSQNLKKVERATGLKFDVFQNADPHIAAFITVGEKKTFMAAHSLDNLEWSIHAAKHELKHKQTCNFMQLGDKKITVFQDQFDVLKDELQTLQVDIEGIDWVEGFTDLLTVEENGFATKSGYADREVPAAGKLDNLCIKKTGASLAEAFNMNHVPLFTARIRRLCEVLLLEKAVKHLANRDHEIEEMQPEIEAKLATLKPMADSKEDAEKAVSKIIAECIALKQVRGYFGRDENLSGVSAPGGMLS